MPIKVTCVCGATAMVNDKLAGRTGQCSVCKAPVIVGPVTETATEPTDSVSPTLTGMKCGLCGRETSEIIFQDDEELCRSCYDKVNDSHDPWFRKFDGLLQLLRPKVNPKAVGFIVLLVVFVFGFVIRLDKTGRGPDLFSIINKGYVTPENRLVLVGNTHYTVINLAGPIKQQTNIGSRPDVNPTMTSAFSWIGFSKDSPDAKLMQGAAEVAISNDSVSFLYNSAVDGNGGWDNLARSNHGFLASPLVGYSYTLYKSTPETGKPTPGKSTLITSCMLVTKGRFSNGSNAVKLFYDPGIGFRPRYIFNTFQLILYGPSYLGLCIAMFVAMTALKTASKAGLLTLSMLLHAVSSFMIFVIVRAGEAWSGYSTEHNYAITYGVFGSLVILAIAMLPGYFRTPSSNEGEV